jgi:hypothetical protein
MTNDIKIIDTQTNEEFIGTIYHDRKTSYLIRFKKGVLPFSKKSGKIFGKYLQEMPYVMQINIGA